MRLLGIPIAVTGMVVQQSLLTILKGFRLNLLNHRLFDLLVSCELAQ